MLGCDRDRAEPHRLARERDNRGEECALGRDGASAQRSMEEPAMCHHRVPHTCQGSATNVLSCEVKQP